MSATEAQMVIQILYVPIIWKDDLKVALVESFQSTYNRKAYHVEIVPC